jgi:hypothetical protein
MNVMDIRGLVPESWHCIDCGANTAPGLPNRSEFERAATGKDDLDAVADDFMRRVDDRSEIYTLRDAVWKAAEMGDGCLCIGCLEKRLGRRLKPKDFKRDHPFNHPRVPATPRLRARRKPRPIG